MDNHRQDEFRKLVEAHYRSLYRFAYSLSRNEADASDLVQQTFTTYAEKSDALRDPSKAKSWLFTTLYREFLRQKKRSERITLQEHESLEQQAPVQYSADDDRIDAKVAVAALETLDEIHRLPLTLFYLQSLSYKEIAAVLDIPIGTVMSRICRGKTILKDTLLAGKPA